ncbi:HAD family hydrolase, partial [Singulisphaera rosea]
MMPGPILAVVFDLDGLMFDTEALFHRVLAAMLAARGKLLTREIMGAMIGRRADEAWPSLRRIAELEESIEALKEEATQRFYAEADAAIHPTPGLIALLDHLETVKLPRAVATSSHRTYAEGLLRGHGLFDRFSFVLTGEDVSRGKPDPEIYLAASARF